LKVSAARQEARRFHVHDESIFPYLMRLKSERTGPGYRSGDANQGREMTVGVGEYEQLDLARAAVQR
jgi:hypothetical protein